MVWYGINYTAKQQKSIYSKMIYGEILSRNPPGRFLKQDTKSKLWSEIGCKKSLSKCSQALREGAPELREVLKESGEEEKESILPPSEAAAMTKLKASRDESKKKSEGNCKEDEPATTAEHSDHQTATSMLSRAQHHKPFTTPTANPLAMGLGGASMLNNIPGQMSMIHNTVYGWQGSQILLAAAAQIHAQHVAQQLQNEQSAPYVTDQEELAQLQVLKEIKRRAFQGS